MVLYGLCPLLKGAFHVWPQTGRQIRIHIIKGGIQVALAKDKILVWIGDTLRNHKRSITMMAYPHGQKKDLELRVHGMASKKVRGARLDYLSFDLLNEQTVPFAFEFVQNLFRIAKLSVWTVCIVDEAPFLEHLALTFLLDGLKEQYPNCEFEFVFDPRFVRRNVLAKWIRKGQLQAHTAETVVQDNLMLQSASFLALIESADLEIQEEFGLQSKTQAQYQMAPLWHFASSDSLYLQALDTEQKKQTALLFERVPAVIETGSFDKWIKRGLSQEALAKMNTLYEMGLPEESLLALNPQKIEQHFEVLCEQLSSAHKPFPQESFEQWMEQVKTALAEVCKVNDLKREQPDWALLTRHQLDAWLEDPRSKTKPGLHLYLFEEEDHIRMAATAYLPWIIYLEKGQDIADELIDTLYEIYDLGPADQVDNLLDRLLPLGAKRILAQPHLHEILHSQSIVKNRFVALYPLEKQEEVIVKQLPKSARPLPDGDLAKEDPLWFSEMINDYLSDPARELLAQKVLEPWQTRLLARSLVRGLSVHSAQDAAEASDRSVAIGKLVIPYLFSSKEQKFLEHLKQAWEIELFARPGNTLSQMRAIERLLDLGLDWSWIRVNLKGNITLQQVRNLARTYPAGRIPHGWNVFVPMPRQLFDWLCEQALSAHTQMSAKEISHSLMLFNEQLLASLFGSAEYRSFRIRQEDMALGIDVQEEQETE